MADHNRTTYEDEAQERSARALVAGAVKGNRESFDELVLMYRDQVYSAAWRLTHNPDDALDVTQEVFLRAYRAVHSYKGQSRFSTWLYRITLNASVDYLRRERRHDHLRDNSYDSEENSQLKLAEERVEATQFDTAYLHQLQEHLTLALNKLSGRQKQVFMLRYYNELELREIAEVLNCSQGSVKRHLFRAQARLRELMRDIRQ
jgi:RNA polymerase sigma-70 factor (ECF subfamily)